MKNKLLLFISAALVLNGCAGGNMDKANVETGKADSIVRARIAQKENELKRANDSIINTRAEANADSIQKYEKEHGRINSYQNAPAQGALPSPGNDVKPVPLPQSGAKVPNEGARPTQQTAPMLTDHPDQHVGAGSGSSKAKAVKK